MKSNSIKAPIAVDRLATPDEILAAVLPFPDPIEECNSEVLREIASDMGGYVRIPALDFETSMMVEELLRGVDTEPN